MRSRARRRWVYSELVRASALTGAFLVIGASCGGVSQTGPVLGSESHFLARCSGSCGGGLECIGGLCTRSCTPEEDTCGELQSLATCTSRDGPGAAVSVCDLPCSEDTTCGGLGAGYVCADAFCRAPDTSLADATLSCEFYLDDSPPPVVRGVTILNTSDVTLYVQTYSPGCPGSPNYEPALVHVSPIGAGDSAPELNVHGIGCAQSCQTVMQNGWTGTGEGGTSPACPELACPPASPLPWVAVEPGQSLFEANRMEFVNERLPRGCADGVVTEAVNCQARRIPPLDGGYFIAVIVSATAGCETSNCVGQIFSRPVGNYFNADNTLEITEPAR